MATITAYLPPYPSLATLKTLSQSQKSDITQSISTSLLHILSLSPAKRDTPQTRAFISSYAHDAAQQVLQGLIWESEGQDKSVSKFDMAIRKRVLLLAENFAASPPGLDMQTLLDLCIAYSQTNIAGLRNIFAISVSTTPSLLDAEIVEAFTVLLSQAHSSGLYGLRKAAHCLLSLLRYAPPELIHLFSSEKPFILALGRTYDDSLEAIAGSYGGIRGHAFEDVQMGEVDDWERIWVETKVSIIDSFHILLGTILSDITSATSINSESIRTLDIILALLQLPNSRDSTSTSASAPTPFLNRPLLADYQHSYDLSRTLATVLRQASAKSELDARLESLESSLRALDISSDKATRDPGVLKLLLRSSGAPIGIDNCGRGTRYTEEPRSDSGIRADVKGKGRAAPQPVFVSNFDLLDEQTNQVLAILPDHDPSYIRALLARPNANVERVVESLLEGTAPSPQEVVVVEQSAVEEDEFKYTRNRQNVFDDDVMDMSRVRVGKKSQDASVILRDRTFIEQIKADILRRAEEIYNSEDSEDDLAQRTRTLAFEDELDNAPVNANKVKILGDGEGSDEDGEGEDTADGQSKQQPEGSASPETVLELAYIRDPKLFDRDAQTRRGKPRADLRALTGWADEQIEGWRIMLERNPKKEKILQKHEFSGNQPLAEMPPPPSSPGGSGGHRGGRGRGRGRGRGGTGSRDRGRGPGQGQGDGAGNEAKDRAWKDKHKASRGNHNRKRGHDKKMARAGGPGPSA